ncbi:MAG TPA: SDR family oxidoreductase [Rhizomicrobium sp.]|nr:SDR family oxidoreductase [Rhizomicrobium sp.]
MARKRRGDGQTALVTGASSGIGLELAKCFAKDGYNLILTARSENTLKQLAEAISKENKVTATPIAADLGKPGGAEKLAGEIKARGLDVDVLVNNAGYGIVGKFDGSNATDEVGMVDLNVRALTELTHAYWPRMIANKKGGVLNVASTASFQPGPGMAVYYATKAYVLSFSEALWKEGHAAGVHVTCLCPGPTDSNFHSRAGSDQIKLLKMGVMMSSRAVARKGYRAFRRNKRVVITGVMNRLLARLVPFMPRRSVLNIVSYLQTV